MAEELSDSEFNEAVVFDDYNPHPYQGGYDVALAYGKPLQATADICYPLSSASDSTSARVPAALLEPTPEELPLLPKETEPEPEPELLLKPPFQPQPPPSLQDVINGTALPSAADPWPYSDPEGNWYVGTRWPAPGCGNSCCGVGNKCRDSLWQRNAADYLFGYLPTWGSKRAETHTYANLNYAYERHLRQQAVSVVVEPEANHTLLSNSWFSSEDFLPAEETLGRELLEWRHAYDSEKSVSVEAQPYQLYSEASFSPVYGEESYQQNASQYSLERHCNKGNADVKGEQSWPGFQLAYNSHAYQYPVTVELNPYPNSETLCYNETYHDESYKQSYALEWYHTEKPVDLGIKVSLTDEWLYENSYQEEAYQCSDGCYAYKPLGAEMSVSVEVQPVSPLAIYHGAYQEEHYPSLDGSHGYERQINDNSSSLHVDPAENLWSLLVNGH